VTAVGEKPQFSRARGRTSGQRLRLPFPRDDHFIFHQTRHLHNQRQQFCGAAVAMWALPTGNMDLFGLDGFGAALRCGAGTSRPCFAWMQ
jgi:hypothetical protein